MDDMAFAALYLLAGIVAPDAAAFGCLTLWVSITPTEGEASRPSISGAAITKMVVDNGEQAAVAPVMEIALYRRWRRKLSKQQAPLAAAGGHVENSVQNSPHGGAGATCRPRRGSRGAMTAHSGPVTSIE